MKCQPIMELLLEEPCLHTHLEVRESCMKEIFLMQMRQSPLAKTPPANLPVIPGVTVPASTSPNKNCASSPKKTNDSGDSERRTSSMDCPSKLQAVPEASQADEEDQFGIEV